MSPPSAPMSPPSGQKGRRKLSTRRKVWFAGVVLMLFGLAAEGLTRGLVHLGILTAASTDNIRSNWAAEDGWAVDPMLGWKLLPDNTSTRGSAICETNALGLRDHDFPEAKPEGEFRVLSIGDSTALGFGVKEQVAYAGSRLEKRLRAQTNRPVEVINAGVPGYSSAHSLLYLERRGLDFEPDAVVIQSNFNDRRAIAPGAQPDSEEQFRSIYVQVLMRDYLDHSAVARVIRATLTGSPDEDRVIDTGDYSYARIDIDSPARVSLAQYEKNMREMIRLSRERGADVYLIGLPDEPRLSAPIREAAKSAAEGDWARAEAELEPAAENPVYAIIYQKLLNQIYENTNRSDRVQHTLPTRIGWMSTDGYVPSALSEPYIAVLERLGSEFDIPVIVPKSKTDLYLDYIHLNAVGHAQVARKLADAIQTSARFRGDVAIAERSTQGS